jgi:hypothetical protein
LRNKAAREGFVCAASSSSFIMDVTAFENKSKNKMFSYHKMVGIVGATGLTRYKIDEYHLCIEE